MNIIESNLSFGGMASRNTTRRIILHHAEATSCTAQDIHRWHKEGNHWAGAGYHFWVRKDGKVFRLRPEWAVGAHAAGANGDSLGICEGAFNVEHMGQAQIQAGRELVADLIGKYGISLVQRHKDMGQTDCPGNNFPFSEIANGTINSKPVTTVPETTNTDGGKVYMFGVREIGNGDYGNDVLLAQEILGSRGYYTGELDKGFGPLMVAATKKYQSDRKGACGAADGIIGKKTWQNMVAL